MHAVRAEVLRYVTAVLGGRDAGADMAAEDVVQETMTRLLENAWRLERTAAEGYALATARNLLVEARRAHDVAERNAARLVHLDRPHDPQEMLERAEERTALSRALWRLPAKERAVLIQRELRSRSTGAVAAELDSNPAAVAATAARARGRLRLEYLLALNRTDLPTSRCRPVLTAIAVGHRRRQAELGAGRHLRTCEVCGPVAAALADRDRHRLLAPVLLLFGGGWAWIRNLVRANPGTATAGAAVATGVTVAVLAIPAPAPAPAPPPPRAVAVGSVDLLPLAGQTSLRQYAGSPARVNRVPVLSVPADEGFWIGRGGSRLWVQFRTGRESRPTVRPGDVVSFAGTVAPNQPGFARRLRLTPAQGAAQLERQDVHLSVVPGAVTLGTRATPSATPRR